MLIFSEVELVCRASIGEIDTDLDSNIDLERIRAEPLKPF